MEFKSESVARDELRIALGLPNPPTKIAGVGQQETFKYLGFNDKAINSLKPDDWYLPNNKNEVAIICETKNSEEPCKSNCDQLEKYIDVVLTKYKKVIGIIYNGYDVIIYKNKERIECKNELFPLEYYQKLFTPNTIDKQAIYNLTKQINDCLHTRFGIKNLNHRMIFTACALVASKEGAKLIKGMDFDDFQHAISKQLDKSLSDSVKINDKLALLSDIYSKIDMNSPNNQVAIDDFIEWIEQLSVYITSDNWNGEDVMGIFFNEFNRYKGTTDKGQVFTPDHITSFMYRLVHCDMNDRILDAACGSGAFLVKAMCNMIKESGGMNSPHVGNIKSNQLFGVEWDKEIFALACANMLIHKDGKTNIIQDDSREKRVGDWIKSKSITKVLMNPPFETKYGCLKIVQNVLDNVPRHTECAFILPDKKLEKDFKDKEFGNKLLKTHTLKKIIKLPENLFVGKGITTSIFIFESGVAHNNKTIQGFYIEDDGLETVKNQGRQDIKDRWQEIEDKWVKIIENPLCNEAKSERNYIQSINPKEHLSYQMPEKSFEIYKEDFIKTAMDYIMFQQGIDVKEFSEKLLRSSMYSSIVNDKNNTICIELKKKDINE